MLHCAMNGDTTIRHDAVKDRVAFLARYAGMRATTEPPHLFSDGKRPDVLINHQIAVDVSVASTLHNASLLAGCSNVEAALHRVVRTKVTKYSAEAARALLTFTPLVLNAFGYIQRDGVALLNNIADEMAQQHHFPRSFARCIVFGSISATLQRQNARMVLKRLPPAAHSVTVPPRSRSAGAFGRL
jgi:hypothetical protein